MTIIIQIKSSNMLQREELQEYVFLLEKYFELPHLNEVQLESLKNSRTLWIIAKENDNTCGIATLTPNKEDNLKNILVLPSYRKKGVCTTMLKVVEKIYKSYNHKMHVPSLTIIKEKENTHMLKCMYEKNSYKITKETHDKIYMTLKV